MFPILYEINSRCWLAALSEAAGKLITLATVPDAEIDSFERHGFTHIWLMGVWKLGTRGRSWSRRCHAGREEEFGCPDIAGSPYAITGYEVARESGGEAGLARFRERLNQRGIGLLLDFIPNHVALDHPWVRAHPDRFITSGRRGEGFIKPHRGAALWFAHGDCGHGSPWVDTLQLDYGSRELQEAMISELLRIAERCDGVRCDMAMLVLGDVFERIWKRTAQAGAGEFWPAAIGAVREVRSNFLFLAEAYWDLEQRLQEAGFDFTYDKRLYDRLVAHDGAGAAAYVNSLPASFIARSAHFLENHDEPRAAGLLSEAEHRAAALLITALPGMRFLHEGQLNGWKRHANVHFARRSAEPGDPRVAAFYEELMGALPKTAVGKGKATRLAAQPAWSGNNSHANFVLVQWEEQADAFDVAVINLAPHSGQCFAPLSVPGLEEREWIARDLLGNEEHVRTGRELGERGFYLDVPGHGAQLFHFSRCK